MRVSGASSRLRAGLVEGGGIWGVGLWFADEVFMEGLSTFVWRPLHLSGNQGHAAQACMHTTHDIKHRATLENLNRKQKHVQNALGQVHFFARDVRK